MLLLLHSSPPSSQAVWKEQSQDSSTSGSCVCHKAASQIFTSWSCLCSQGVCCSPSHVWGDRKMDLSHSGNFTGVSAGHYRWLCAHSVLISCEWQLVRSVRQRGWRQLSIPGQLHRDFCLPSSQGKGLASECWLVIVPWLETCQCSHPCGCSWKVPWAGGRWLLLATCPSRRALLAMARGWAREDTGRPQGAPPSLRKGLGWCWVLAHSDTTRPQLSKHRAAF